MYICMLDGQPCLKDFCPHWTEIEPDDDSDGMQDPCDQCDILQLDPDAIDDVDEP